MKGHLSVDNHWRAWALTEVNITLMYYMSGLWWVYFSLFYKVSVLTRYFFRGEFNTVHTEMTKFMDSVDLHLISLKKCLELLSIPWGISKYIFDFKVNYAGLSVVLAGISESQPQIHSCLLFGLTIFAFFSAVSPGFLLPTVWHLVTVRVHAYKPPEHRKLEEEKKKHHQWAESLQKNAPPHTSSGS